jgi:hypothetical protein
MTCGDGRARATWQAVAEVPKTAAGARSRQNNARGQQNQSVEAGALTIRNYEGDHFFSIIQARILTAVAHSNGLEA